ncbi:MAG: MSMEG_4193 family putative phosphomutase [Chloroflexota bacterium]
MSKAEKKQEKKAEETKPTTVLLVRHGQNDWVGKHKLAGWTPGVHLNPYGRKQAESVGKRLAKTRAKIDKIYASPLERTVETAELIAKHIDVPIKTYKKIGEVEYGDWTGKEIKKLAEKKEWAVVQYYPSDAQFPKGESLYEMQARAVQAVNKLVKKHPGQTLLLVSHADLIKSVIAHYLGVHLDLFQRIVVSPASITTIVFTFMRPMVYTVNDTSHLPPPPKEKKG